MQRFFSISPLAPCVAGGMAVLALFFLMASSDAADKADKPYTPHVAAASNEGAQSLKRIRVPDGIRGTVWATEPLLANPVSFCFDEKGRCFVAETFRLHHGVTDDRGHMYWLDDDLACRTVADRVAMYRKHLKDKFATYETEHDRVRMIEDTRGNGTADKATVFADGFHNAADGIGSGVLARNGTVWYTCIPDLWKLQDTKGVGKADVKQSLATGFGVHVAFLGHDLHGLRMGPDGKIYFSIGDRGLNVTTREGKQLFNPDSGAVLRCDPDGSNLELFATGLRNPQELAFDDHGNWFTVDNNSDSGDKARVAYIVDGGDSGWRTGYQYGSNLSDRGPFNAEKIWHLPNEEQPGYIVPPLAHLADGPSGLCYNPGVVALPERYAGHFFLADFRGGSGDSGIRSFAFKPKGAAFEVVDRQEFVWRVLATDCDFGPDGGFYVLDWTEGWEISGKGRIYRFADPTVAANPAIAEVKKLLGEGFDKRSAEELAKLLGHDDQRIRLEAQFALANRGEPSINVFAKIARERTETLPRIHAIWGLGQIARTVPAALEMVLSLTRDRDAEVRSQAAKVLGEAHAVAAVSKLIGLLHDPESRVRFLAAIALGKIGSKECIKPILEVLRENADRDRYLRHAAVMALAGAGDRAALVAVADDSSPAVRLGALLALRRLEAPEIVRYLNDSEPRLVLEAARAINDLPIAGALPQLAALANRSGLADLLWFRIINANFRLGKPENAAVVAGLAARSDVPEAIRIDALQSLDHWTKPRGLDRVVGLWRPLEPRAPEIATNALRAGLGGVFAGPDKVRQEAAKVASSLGIKEVGPALVALATDTGRPVPVRVEALRALGELNAAGLGKARDLALQDSDPRIRTEGCRLLAKEKPSEALALLGKILHDGSVAEQQGAFGILGELKSPQADALLAQALDKLLKGELAPETHLDLLQAAAKHTASSVTEKLQRYEASREQKDHLAPYRETLTGGDADAGKRIFATRAEVSCVRCHKINGEGGEVGPDLSGIGSRQKRDYLLESLVDPNRQIAKGFETVVVTLNNGKTLVGVFKSEDADELRLMTSEGQLVKVPKKQIDERQAGKSAMPEDLVKRLTKSELRDLVEFLAQLKEAKAK